MLARYLAAAAAALIVYIIYARFGLPVRCCRQCGGPVSERKAFPWTGPDGNTVYTHIGQCSDAYAAYRHDDHYRPGEGP